MEAVVAPAMLSLILIIPSVEVFIDFALVKDVFREIPSTVLAVVAMLIVFVVWILVIIFSDFVYGFGNFSGTEIFEWLEDFIYHLLILFSILKASKGALKGVVNK